VYTLFVLSLTTSEKATARDPRIIESAALYLSSTIVAIKLHEMAPRIPDRMRYDLLRYPNRGTESLHRK
jgi:hypothetical protein